MSKQCVKCNEPFKGFGDTCSRCRRMGKSGTFRECEVCGTYVAGFGAICDSCAKGEPDNHVCVMPVYTVPEGKMADFKATFPAFYSAVQKGPKESLYFGWAVSDDNQVICRQAFTTAKALLGQLHEVGVALEVCRTVLGEEGRVDITVSGPASELAQLRTHLAVLSPTFYELDPGSRWYNRGAAGPDTHLQVSPTYKIASGKVDNFVGLVDKFYQSSKTSTKERLYYGWARDGDTFYCRQGFKSAEGYLAHLQDVKDVQKQAIDMSTNGVEVTILGPQEEIEKLKASSDEALKRMTCHFFELDQGSVWL